MDENVGTDDVFDGVQHRRPSCEIANPFKVKVTIAFLLSRGPAPKLPVQFIVRGSEVGYFFPAQRREWKQQPVSVIFGYLIGSQDFSHDSILLSHQTPFRSPRAAPADGWYRHDFARVRLPGQN